MKLTVDKIVKIGIVAAIYFALTIVFSAISYGPIQFRVAEILNMLTFYHPMFGPGITLGVFLSNINSPLGLYDLFFGTLHTAISLFFMARTKNKILASLWPSIFSFIIGFELFLLYGGGFKGFLSMTLSVMVSELFICTFISLAVYGILEKNKAFQDMIKKLDYIKK